MCSVQSLKFCVELDFCANSEECCVRFVCKSCGMLSSIRFLCKKPGMLCRVKCLC